MLVSRGRSESGSRCVPRIRNFFVRSAHAGAMLVRIMARFTKGTQTRSTTDEPLPVTLGFVLVLGGLIAVGWFAMFLLVRSRW